MQTLRRTGHATLLSRELSQYNNSIAGIFESRRRESGEKVEGDHSYIWSGPNDNRGLFGDALEMPRHIRKSLIGWTPVSERLLTARFHHQHSKLTVIVAYAATEVTDDQTKSTFFDQLHLVIQQIPPHHYCASRFKRHRLLRFTGLADQKHHWPRISRSHHQQQRRPPPAFMQC